MYLSKLLSRKTKQPKLSKMGSWQDLVVFKNLSSFSSSSSMDLLSFFSDFQEWAISSSVIQEYSCTFNTVRF